MKPAQQCLVTGRAESKETPLLKLVCSPDGVLVADIMDKLPGKAIHVEAHVDTVSHVCSDASLLEKRLGVPVTVPENLQMQIRTQLIRHIQSRLALARKSGNAVCGHMKMREWIEKDNAILLCIASDAGTEARKLPLSCPVWRLLDRQQLGQPFGREQVVYVALNDLTMAERISYEMRRLTGFNQSDAL